MNLKGSILKRESRFSWRYIRKEHFCGLANSYYTKYWNCLIGLRPFIHNLNIPIPKGLHIYNKADDRQGMRPQRGRTHYHILLSSGLELVYSSSS